MQKFSWTCTIKVNILMLKCVGLWPEGSESYKLNLYTLYAVINGIIIIGGHNFSQFINIFFVYTDLEVLSATIFVLITNILATVKMWFYIRNVRLIKKLLLFLDNEEQFQPDPEQMHLIEPSLNLWKLSYSFFCTIVGINLVLWIIGPFLNENQKLPFVAWYPFSIETTPNYQLVYIYQAICIVYITAANLNLDTISFALMMYIGAQCDMLCDNLSKLECKNSFEKTLIRCIKHHKMIVRFAKISNDLFNLIILGQFFTSTMALALTMFQLSLVDPKSQAAVTHASYLSGMTTQILLYCWFGNEVEIKSNEIPYAAFKSNWYEQSTGCKRNLLILGIRCQRPIRITAIKLFGLTLRTFMAILRSSWSYFAVLYSVNQ